MKLNPITLGDIHIEAPVFLAPMSGISDLPFRDMVQSFGAGLVFSEMIASREMINHSEQSLRMATPHHPDYPLAVQLAGCEPDVMAEAAKMNEDRGASIIDINFGCPVKKIVKKYAGSALMQDEDLATRIMEAVVKAVNIPVTMKTRLGWDAQNLNAPSLCKKAEDVGIQMITIHGRTREQLYNGTADWKAIRAVREAISLPLIANGDIMSVEDVKDALDQSGADGVMIGRGTQGKPWFIKQVMDYARTGEIPPPPDNLLDIIMQHYDDIIAHYGEGKGVPIARKHLAWYVTGMTHANEFRSEINKVKEAEKVKEMVKDFFNQAPHPSSFHSDSPLPGERVS
jgi:tRNA-dihydrouridine synthase B